MVVSSPPTPPPPPKPPKPIPPPAQPPPPIDTRNPKKSINKGIASTILTSPLGDLTPAQTTKKTLLGGS